MPSKSVGDEFVKHRLLSRIQHFPKGKELPLPLDMEKYDKDDTPCQTTDCTNVAVQLYNAQQAENCKKIRRAVGEDSQMFVLDQNDPISYWHLYFKGTVARKPCKFFAELSGEGGPKQLRICQLVDKAVAASVLNCDHCFGGIWHPFEGFLGCKKKEDEDEKGKEDEEEDEDEEEEEEEEDEEEEEEEEEEEGEHTSLFKDWFD